MAEITGLKKLVAQLQAKAAKAAKEQASVKVGYQAQYAGPVHEDLEAKHPNGGEAKFLEKPARTMQQELADGIKDDFRRGKTMGQALLIAGLKLQRASQELVPVDTGNLRASAFTELTEG